MRCSFCNSEKDGGSCPACFLYNGAVAAQKAAATEIALQRNQTARDAWLNEYGIFARVDTEAGPVTIQLGSEEEAAPFVYLTGAIRRIKSPWRKADIKERLKEDRAKQRAAIKAGR